MTALLINGLAGLMLIFFGAMALAPLFFSEGTSAQPTPQTSADEDRVLHVSPVPMIERIRPVAENQPLPLGNVPSAGDSSRRDAA